MTQAYTQDFTEVHEIAAHLPAGNHAIGTHYTGWADMANRQRAALVISMGEDQQQFGLVVSYLEEARDANGTGAQILDGWAKWVWVDQLWTPGDYVVIIEARAEELSVSDGYSHIRGVFEVEYGPLDLSAVMLLGCSNDTPVPVPAWAEVVV